MNELEKRLLNEIYKGIDVAIQTQLSGYNSPLNEIVNRVIQENDKQLYNIVSNCIYDFLDSNELQIQLKQSINSKFAKILVSKMGGSLEKRVNELNADPVSRAKLTLAITNIVDEMVKK